MAHIASELSYTKKVHLTLQVQETQQTPWTHRIPHHKPYVFLWIRALDSHFRSQQKV